jgi:hypothetical protein
MGCYLIATTLMKNKNRYYRQSVKYMTASLLLMPFAGAFGVSIFYGESTVEQLMYIMLFVLFGTFAWVFFDDALRLLSKSEKQSKKIVHQLYTPYEQYKMDMEIEEGSEKEKMMDRFHAKYSPIKGTEL